MKLRSVELDGPPHGREGGGDERRMRRAARGRLPKPADPKAGEREDERREPERLQRADVEHEARPESGDGAGERAAQQRDRDERS